MSRRLAVGIGLIAATNAMWFLSAQEFNTTEKTPQYSNAKQPAKSTAPPTRARPPLDRQPRLVDPATDENGNPLLDTKLERADKPTVAGTRIVDPDRVLATWIALSNQEELELAQLGSQRASSLEVKDFAKLLVDDHAALHDALLPFAPEIATPNFLNVTAKDARANGTAVRKSEDDLVTVEEPAVGEEVPALKNGRRTAEPRATASAGRDFNVEQVERELAVQRLASSRTLLGARRGPDFDRFFMVQQFVMHKALRDKLIVYQRHVSGSLAEVLANAEKASDLHMTKALDLIKRLPETASTTPASQLRSAQKVATDRK